MSTSLVPTSSTSLAVSTQSALQLDFSGAIMTVVSYNGEPYVPMKSFVDNLGLSWGSQCGKLNAGGKFQTVMIKLSTPGGDQTCRCLHLRHVAMWISSLYPSRVKKSIRGKLTSQQQDYDLMLYQQWRDSFDAFYEQSIEELLADMQAKYCAPDPFLMPVSFHEDLIYLLDINGEPYVPMRPIVKGIGLNWDIQREKINTRFSKVAAIQGVPTRGGIQQALCLPLRKLPAWLYTVNPDKVAPHLRDKIIAYQQECDEVLWQHWKTKHALKPKWTRTSSEPESVPSTAMDKSTMAPVVQVLRMMQKSISDIQADLNQRSESATDRQDRLKPKHTH
jgi:hypothetical protein